MSCRSSSIFIALVLSMSGCASLSKSECMKGDWAAIGKSDGYNGLLPTRINDHVEACAEYGVRPNATLYQQGYRQGLAGYCTGTKGFEAGRFNHGDYNGQCPQPSEGVFLAAMELGIDAYNLDVEITNIHSRIYDLEKKAKDKDTSDADRKSIQREIYDLYQRRDRRQADLDRVLSRADARGYR